MEKKQEYQVRFVNDDGTLGAMLRSFNSRPVAENYARQCLRESVNLNLAIQYVEWVIGNLKVEMANG